MLYLGATLLALEFNFKNLCASTKKTKLKERENKTKQKPKDLNKYFLREIQSARVISHYKNLNPKPQDNSSHPQRAATI